MSIFVGKQQQDKINHWLFRSVCRVTVGDVTEKFSRVLALDHDTTILEAFGIMEELLIHSVAVTGPPGMFGGMADGVELIVGGKQYIGIASVLDMLAYSLQHEDFLTHQLSDVIGSTTESQTFWCENTDHPLYFAIEQFVQGVHHALVRQADDVEGTMPLKFLAQTDILRFLTSDPTALPHLKMLFDQSVESSGVASIVKASVSLTTPLKEAISLLVQYSSLPVVNDQGIVVSNLSVSDFKGKRTVHLLSSPEATVQCLLRYHAQAVDPQPLHAPVTMSNTSSLHDAANFMLRNHVHRIWIVPSGTDSVPTEVPLEGLHVLTITDILRAVYVSEQR